MTIQSDLRQALRGFARTPAFTILAVATIAIGIGATTAVFSVVNEVMFRPLAVRDPGSLVMLWESNEERGWHQVQIAGANATEWRARVRSFEDVAIVTEQTSDVSLSLGEAPVTVRSASLSGNTFDLLGAVPLLGRNPRWEDSFQEAAPQVVLSHALWVRELGADSSIVGRTIRIDGNSFTVASVLKPSFRYPVNDAEMWTAYRWTAATRTGTWFKQAHVYRAIARLRDGVTAQTAERELATVMANLETDFPQTNRGMKAGLTPLHEFLVGDRSFPLLLLLGAVGLLQLIVCANVANLLLARSLARKQEMAVRVALGAARGRIARLVFTESVALAAIGSLLGLGLGVYGLDAIAALRPDDLPGLTFRFDWRMLGFTMAVACGSALLFGIQPALSSSRVDIARQMADGQRTGSSGRKGQLAAHAITAFEVALAVMLVTGAGLMLRSIGKLRQVEPGVNTAGVLTFEVRPPSGTYRSDEAKAAFAQRLIERLRATPGIREAGAGRNLPFMGVGWSGDFTMEGWSADRFGMEVRHREVTPGYFSALEVPLREGVLFGEQAAIAQPYPVVVNQAFVEKYFKDQSPVGQRITFNRVPDSTSVWYLVAGVVGNERMQLTSPPVPEIIGHLAYDTPGLMRFVVKVAGDPDAVVPSIRAALAAIDPEVGLMKLRSMDDVALDALAADRYLMVLLGVFGVAALVLAAVGVYGVTAQVARSRRREIGIRLALGATTADVARALARRGLAFVGVGVVVGVVGALAGGGVLRRLLFGVEPTDAVTLVAVTLLLVSVALVATLLPAWRASRLDPVEVLGAE